LYKKAIFFLFVFIVILLLILSDNNTLSTIDTNITLFANTNRIEAFDGLVNFISNLATPVLLIAIGGFGINYLVKKQTYFKVLFLFGIYAFACSAITIFIIKNLVQRCRPFTCNSEIIKLGSGGSYSFPSGHTTDAFLLFFIVVYSVKKNNLLKSICFVWALFIAYSRMYLGVHYITDLFAAICIAYLSVSVIKQQKYFQILAHH